MASLGELPRSEKRPSRYIPPKRIVHFDLKGAPPKIDYLKKIITLVKQAGATGLLFEWEDMFPFYGELAPIKAGNAYSREEIESLVKFAADNELEVIPLVQTFGHVEFALKTEAFASLREVPSSPQALCPSNDASLDFVKALIRQAMELTPDVNYLHIGCDEVFQMGACSKCSLLPRHNVFLSHVSEVATFVRSNYPNVTPIIWDDMLRRIPVSTMNEYGLGDLVEPMMWVYAEDVYKFVSPPGWDKYAQVFPRAWTASAFKGAFGETLYVANAHRHLGNNLTWLKVMAAEAGKFKQGFAGIALTGWQRYDHFAILCELLPAAVPSLALTLLATSHGFFDQTLLSKLHEILSSEEGIYRKPFKDFETDPYLWSELSNCSFPGIEFYRLLSKLEKTERRVAEYVQSVTRIRGWMTEYNVRRNFSSPLRVDELTRDLPGLQWELKSLAKQAQDALKDIFDPYTIAEWVEQRIYPDLKQLETLAENAKSLKAVKYWAPRPLPPLQQLSELGLMVPEEEPSNTE